jgi:hypothetical protein
MRSGAHPTPFKLSAGRIGCASPAVYARDGRETGAAAVVRRSHSRATQPRPIQHARNRRCILHSPRRCTVRHTLHLLPSGIAPRAVQPRNGSCALKKDNEDSIVRYGLRLRRSLADPEVPAIAPQLGLQAPPVRVVGASVLRA